MRSRTSSSSSVREPGRRGRDSHPAATAYLALFTHGRVRAGETVVVAGAAGNVGSALVVLATQAGARVTATARDSDYC